jgi:hypothetical protein
MALALALELVFILELLKALDTTIGAAGSGSEAVAGEAVVKGRAVSSYVSSSASGAFVFAFSLSLC